MSWADQALTEDGTIRAQNLGAAVCADGANGTSPSLRRPSAVSSPWAAARLAVATTTQQNAATPAAVDT
jgi:hypothetical protein